MIAHIVCECFHVLLSANFDRWTHFMLDEFGSTKVVPFLILPCWIIVCNWILVAVGMKKAENQAIRALSSADRLLSTHP
jgi:hypothetical protein